MLVTIKFINNLFFKIDNCQSSCKLIKFKFVRAESCSTYHCILDSALIVQCALHVHKILHSFINLVSAIAVFVLKRDAKLQLTLL